MLAPSKIDEKFLKNVLQEVECSRFEAFMPRFPIFTLKRLVEALSRELCEVGDTSVSADVHDRLVEIAALALRVATERTDTYPSYAPLSVADPDPQPVKAWSAWNIPDGVATRRLSDSPPPTESPLPAAAPADAPPPPQGITGWIAIIREPGTPRDAESVYVCPTIWPDRYEAVKAYGYEKIAAFVPLNTFHGDK